LQLLPCGVGVAQRRLGAVEFCAASVVVGDGRSLVGGAGAALQNEKQENENVCVVCLRIKETRT